MSTQNAFCIHAHFYQPPRENPFTGIIPKEPGAAPYANWNEKIYQQCYKPNAELQNFERISFNIGPTLARWMEEFHPETMAQIVKQENIVYQRYGVSNAMAQAYNHTILPLATYDEKVIQVRWGIADFEKRFGHKPQGMWMPETAVDMETLSVMAAEGIEFTIMAPWQAKRRVDFDPSQPYLVDLPNGKKITVFFYNMDLSMKVSFRPESTANADEFMCQELLPLYPQRSHRGRLNLIATDGEFYGHHQPFRDKFLEWLTTGALQDRPIDLTFPALWLRQFPPTHHIRIQNNTSWSCLHGVKRWCDECGCAEHGEWKAGLRRVFKRIAAYVDAEISRRLEPYGVDLMSFYTENVNVLTHSETPEQLICRLFGPNLSESESQCFKDLICCQYERNRMFTSCGWFFGELEGIEPRNNIAYAAKALCLIEKYTGERNFRKQILRALTQVRSATSGVRAGTIFHNAIEQNDKLNAARR